MKINETAVIEILKKYNIDKKLWENYTDNFEIIRDLRINSARIVDIVLDIEEEYDIEIDDDSLERIITIKDIKEIIKEKLE